MATPLKVLIVEDSEDDAELVLQALRGGGFEPDSMTVDSEKAMRSALKEGRWEVVLCDKRMPRFSASAALEIAKEVGLDAPFIVVSGAIRTADAITLLKAGAHDFVRKDDLARLVPAVERELRDAETRRRRQLAEQALKESEERFRQFFENSPTPMRVVDFSRVKTYLDGLTVDSNDLETWLLDHPKVLEECVAQIRVIDANEAAQRLLRAKDKAELLASGRNLYTPNTYKAFAVQFAQIHGGARSFDLEMELSALDGSRRDVMLRWAVLPGYEQTLARALVSMTDITERKQMEEALRRSQKMEAVGELTGGIAHDFNNLLGIIIGNLDLLENQVEGNEVARKQVATALRSALRGADLSRRLLAFSNQTTEAASPIDLNEVLAGMDTLLRRSLTAEVDLEMELAGELWLAEVDKGDFEDAVVNLAINARDAMPEGGRLVIETGNRVVEGGMADGEGDITPGDYVLVSIGDTGTGMSAETVEKIFEPFFTTKGPGKGTGLGLSMVYGFVKRSRGHIGVYSEPGCGTTFRIYLPRTTKASDRADADEGVAGELPRGDETILVVDDEEDIAAFVKAALEKLGYGVLVAADAPGALRVLERNDGVELLLSDVVMPGGMSGFELARTAKEKYPDLRVLMSSGFTQRTQRSEKFADLAKDMIAKPYRESELARRVRRALDEGGTSR